MNGFDYLGDAVWLLAWRAFEAREFKNFSGWHRCLREQIVKSNQFMNMVALAEKIQPIGVSHKALADGLEHAIGKTESNAPASGVRLAMQIMERRINVGELQTEIDRRVARNRGRHIPKGPKVQKKFLKLDCPKLGLGELF